MFQNIYSIITIHAFIGRNVSKSFFILKESSPFGEPLKLKMPAGSGHAETDGG